MKTLIELHFFPCLEYFYHLNRSELFILEAHESFQKQSYRSRCEILSPNGVLSFNIPIIHGETRNSIQTTLIEYKQNWVLIFWKTLEAAYKRSPYFDYFEMIFKPILFQKEESLFNLNLKILKGCIQFLSINTKLVVTEKFNEQVMDVEDLRNTIFPKREKDLFLFSNYPQNFGESFINNLSIIDLMMNEGPAGLITLISPQKSS